MNVHESKPAEYVSAKKEVWVILYIRGLLLSTVECIVRQVLCIWDNEWDYFTHTNILTCA